MLFTGKKIKIVIYTIAFMFCLSLIGLGTIRVNASDNRTVSQILSSGAAGENEICISAAGDCTLGRDMSQSYTGSLPYVLDKQKGNYSYFFNGVRSIFKSDDISIVNLETTLTDATIRADKKFAFRGDMNYTKILTDGSIEAVNIANNHIHDYGDTGFKETVAALKKEGIGVSGEGYTYIRTVKGVKVGFTGYRGWSDGKWFRNMIQRDIKSLRSKGCGIVIVTFHWGVEGDNYPEDIQRNLGKFSIDSGADLVIGHHPHVIQGIESYKGKYIVYSLGNFIFGGNRNPKDKDTMIFQQHFLLDDSGKIVQTVANVIPCSISSNQGYNDYRPMVLKDNAKAGVIGRLNDYSNNIGTYIDEDGILVHE